jgi:hypothetical protein
MFNSVRLVCLLAVASLAAAPLSSALAGESDSHEEHVGHSDYLLILMHHKIALQKLQDQDSEQSKANTLVKQGQHLRKVMPVLKRYMATPKSYYLNTEMYHDSLDNRAAMLADFSAILIEYQKQLVSLP